MWTKKISRNFYKQVSHAKNAPLKFAKSFETLIYLWDQNLMIDNTSSN